MTTSSHQWKHIKLTGAIPPEGIDPERRDGSPTQDWNVLKWGILLTVISVTLLGIARFVELKYFKTWK